jgi:hypothetical protein
MAEILVKAVDATNADPEKDRGGCYKRGYPVVVKEDNHPGWGREEGPPNFFVIKLPGVPADVVKKYIEEWRIYAGIDDRGMPWYKNYQRRKWKIGIDSLPTTVKNKLLSQGSITIKASPSITKYDIDWSTAKQYFFNMETNTVETQDLVAVEEGVI